LARADCPICRGGGFVHPRSLSGKADYSRLIPCRCVKAVLDKAREGRLQEYSNLRGTLASITFGSLPRGDLINQRMFVPVCEEARKFADSPKGWFVLSGPSGSGKTLIAAAIANERIKHGQEAFFQNVPDLLDHLRAAFTPSSEMPYDELFERVSNTPVLILDDLGVQACTPWAGEKLYQLLNHRFVSELPTVITLGVSLEELDERLRTRMSDSRVSRVYYLEDKSNAGRAYGWGPQFELQKNMKFENFDSRLVNILPDQRQSLESAYNEALEFAKSPDGWLVFQGVNGCGKTHLASAIVNHRYQLGKPALFVVVPEFLDHLRRTFSPESKVSYDQFFESVKEVPFLVLDDFGEQAATPWAQEKLYQVINYRYNARLATVITTSSSLDEIEDRISSRLADTKISNVFNISAPDFRSSRRPNSPPPRGPSRAKKNSWNRESR
jgi:DNA replication protein DnaC